MTKITYYEANDEISIDISGHAGFDKIGSDIVCSAISMLGQTLLAYLGIDNEKFSYEMKQGHIWAYAKGANVRTAFHVIMAGYHLLETNYPDYIQLERGCCMQRSSEMIDCK